MPGRALPRPALLGALAALIALAACGGDGSEPLRFVAVTFNTGTSNAGDPDHPDGYTDEAADFSDAHYGDGLAWLPAVEAARSFFAERAPEVVAFQEIFYSGECPSVPVEARPGFVCEDWREGDPTVAEVILGEGYQIACNLGKPDKCLAVRRDFGAFRGCEGDLCLDGLAGARVPDCGGGSRVGRGVIDTVTGHELTVVNVHGSSGLFPEDMGCRQEQFDQIFVDLGDGSGEPAANGRLNLVMGDLNTDPGRALRLDDSAVHFTELADEAGFTFITEVGRAALGTYAGGGLSIDHVLSDRLGGTCVAPGYSEGLPRIYEPEYFDHTAIVCTLER